MISITSRIKSNNRQRWSESYLVAAETQSKPATFIIRRGGGDLPAWLEPSLQGHLLRLSSLAISRNEVGLASRSEARKGAAALTC
jgi:hypothetical protein